ncbi:hypothetical protein ACOME3_007765 [Neoechinorhynchus agilis]
MNSNTKVWLLEEDFYILPDAVHMIKQMESIPDCSDELMTIGHFHSTSFGDKELFDAIFVGTYRYYSLASAVFSQRIWNRLQAHANFFCSYNDYNWDWTMLQLLKFKEPQIMKCKIAFSRIMHIGKWYKIMVNDITQFSSSHIFSGFHHHDTQSCSPADAVEKIEQYIERDADFFFKGKRVIRSNEPEGRIDPNGWWDSQFQYQLCCMNTQANIPCGCFNQH